MGVEEFLYFQFDANEVKPQKVSWAYPIFILVFTYIGTIILYLYVCLLDKLYNSL